MQSAVRSSVESIWGLHMESPFVKGLNRYPQPLSPFWYFLETNLLVLHKVGCGKQRTIHIYLNHRYSKSIQKLIYITFVQHYMNPIYWNWPFFWWKKNSTTLVNFKAVFTLPLFTSSQTSCFGLVFFGTNMLKRCSKYRISGGLSLATKACRSSSTKPRRFENTKGCFGTPGRMNTEVFLFLRYLRMMFVFWFCEDGWIYEQLVEKTVICSYMKMGSCINETFQFNHGSFLDADQTYFSKEQTCHEWCLFTVECGWIKFRILWCVM